MYHNSSASVCKFIYPKRNLKIKYKWMSVKLKLHTFKDTSKSEDLLCDEY